MDDGVHRGRVDYSHDIKVPLAIRALRKSMVRKKIAEYLFDISPHYSYTADIAYHVRTTPSNVIGAIRGMHSRYKEEESLVSLDIVEEKECAGNIRLYGITEFGKEMLKTFNSRG